MSLAVHSIVVLRPNHRLGNTLLLMPLVQELQERFAHAQITVVSGSGAAPGLFRAYERVCATQYLPPVRPREAGKLLRTLRELRQSSFDLAIDPIVRSRMGRFLLGYVQARERVGFVWGEARRDRVLTHAADPRGAPAHFTQAPIWLLRTAYLGESNGPELAPRPMDLRLSEEERRHGAQRLAATLGSASAVGSTEWHARPKVGLFANATGDKLYPLSWWRQLIGCFSGSHIQFVEIIPEDGRPRLAAEIPGVHTPDLRLLGATLAATSLLVVADGGVMHLAEAAGAPVLGLFRTTEPSQYAPLRAGNAVLRAADLSAETVAARMRELLDGTAGRATG
ncbi:MAG TPA: glycosyltransferase family 9 protein [Steroidobacteraceae bacterium]|jgi:ADP-heptose:LPS heptosyltransferase|nr:glycosyltransferase family 9 protein [Steroidobacteraceae bacterium]